MLKMTNTNNKVRNKMLAYTDTIETKEQAVTNAKLHREQELLGLLGLLGILHRRINY